MNDFTKDTGIPLNEWQEEQIPVKTNHFNPITNQITQTTEFVTQRVKYINAPPEKVSCKEEEHMFFVKDPHKWLFKCSRCPLTRFARPDQYVFKQGKLIKK